MSHAHDATTVLDKDAIGDARAAIHTLAWTHGITGARESIDTFVDAAARLSDAEAEFDHCDRLLIELGRRGLVSDEERFALHAAYLVQRARGL